ncbi:MAG: sigma 54-interacting transcriptional regulator [Candidatus Marinimicrobia bacterium]|nr:sigma 54-interacting transcriptional regulator [Candidatus Neomarinimicrobiota bacterium]
MTKSFTWTAEERGFLRLVSRAAFCNPFSAERERLDRELAGPGPARELAIDRAIRVVRERLAAWDARGATLAGARTVADREIFRSALLFDLFHQYLERFDALILAQVAAGDEPVRVPFAAEALADLRRRGFSRSEAAWALALFYQMRRAYYFIRGALVGQSAAMRQLRIRLWNNLFTYDTRLYVDRLWNRMEDFATLLLGATGTGKGAAAGAIGRSAYIPFDEPRGSFQESFSRTFVAINLSQFPAPLIESELFGHKKGAFTGALAPHQGLFARCSPHGAVFLDEIGELTIPVQIKLLQVLQERVFSPVGSHEKLRFSGRVIAATNQPMDDLRRAGRFRDDFYYRLCSDVIEIPTLQQRLAEDPGELDRLIAHLVRRLAGPDAAELTDIVRSALARQPGPHYPWPGNVRELEQAIRRILLTQAYHGDTRHTTGEAVARLAADVTAGALTADELLARYCRHLYQRNNNYEAVARQTGLDRRTVKRYVTAPEPNPS